MENESNGIVKYLYEKYDERYVSKDRYDNMNNMNKKTSSSSDLFQMKKDLYKFQKQKCYKIIFNPNLTDENEIKEWDEFIKIL